MNLKSAPISALIFASAKLSPWIALRCMPTTTAARILSLIAYRAFRFHVWRICRTTWSFLTTTMVMTMWWTEADIAAVAVVVSLRPLMQRRWHSLADLTICRPQLPTNRAFLN
jgi:hypothetical protein